MLEITVSIVSACLSSWSMSGQRNDVVCLKPDVGKLMDLLDQLDADVTDMLAIRTDKDAVLLIGGGVEQFVIVYSGSDGSSWSRRSENDPGRTISLVMGGQQGAFPSELVCSKAETQSVLTQFSLTDEMDASAWVRDV